MGSAKNKKNPHVSREKFRKRLPPQCQNWEHEQKENISPGCSTILLEGSLIINLQQLASFVKDISSHPKSCLMGNISLVKHIAMVWHLFSVRNVVAVKWRLHFQHHKRLREWVVGSIGNIMSQLCGGRCLLVVAMHTWRKPCQHWVSQHWRRRPSWQLSLPLTNAGGSLLKSQWEAAEEEKRMAIERGSYHEEFQLLQLS